jgi:hypothetical protein
MIAFDLQLHPLCELFPPMSQSELQALAKNTIFITIAFKEAVDFKDAFSHTSTLLRYSSQDRRQIPSRQGGKGRGSRSEEVVTVFVR